MGPFQQNNEAEFNLYFEVLENAFQGIVVVDPGGYILFMNKAYKQFLGAEEVVGRHVTEVIENTRMHIVAQLGKAEVAGLQRIKGHDMIANRIPIYVEGKLIAVLGTVIFQDVRELHALAATVDRLKQEVAYYKEELRKKLGATYEFEQIVGATESMQAAKQLSQKVAKSDTTILITGESGTGKELFAHAIHAASRRNLGPFIRINCAAIPDALLESELFGYEEGAFTGAVRKGKKGKFELANHGTILLDEIGDMPLVLQSKLLRVLQEKEIERIGGTHPISIDVRVISSTNRNLQELVREGRFREDLYYRLHVVSIHIPPLRERLEDIPEIAKDLLDQLMESTGIPVNHIDPDVWNVLKRHDWPGNVRELRNVLERALHLMERDTLNATHIMIPISQIQEMTKPLRTLRETVRAAEKEAIVQVLAATNGDKLKAAKFLDISRSSLYQKLLDYEIV
ncbi:sigma 54-interacting transcriptional regulator [Fodinisporobacter ferrooxydans]|uniref:Sigma 54-interacting transcriptional regulator n=1 Tax=Fodinisporobacter ferrooxydans TaxID=2901836 RepID=A0ABY4CE21_9BACL|nr:sigma 54-interacting transcriptional regulator [Alicyclobacillaceae bacterium MYW30-H2]